MDQKKKLYSKHQPIPCFEYIVPDKMNEPVNDPNYWLSRPCLLPMFITHVYYNAESKSKAQALSGSIKEKLSEAEFDRWHDRPIGPHPDWIGNIHTSQHS